MLAAVSLKGTAQMTLSDLGSIANLLAAIGVLVTLGYLSRQVRQANMLAKAQHRQRMVEQTCEELYVWKNDPILRNCFIKKGELRSALRRRGRRVSRAASDNRLLREDRRLRPRAASRVSIAP
jgi:hypothetical protein